MVSPADLPHLRPVKPVHFPASDPEWEMSEPWTHGRLCDVLYQVLTRAVGDRGIVGKDHFVYFDATNPQRKNAPDAFVKLGPGVVPFDSWKVWEQGTPELCVEILSPSDTEEKLTFDEKMERYRALGVRELVTFNVDAPVGSRLRAWDRLSDDLVERLVVSESTPCFTLGLYWVIAVARAPSSQTLSALRLATDPAGQNLIMVDVEVGAVGAARAEAEEIRADAEAARADAEAARAEAEAARAAAEAARAEAEAARAAAEAARAEAEAARADAAEAENARLRAELEAARS
jgi:hypothetical protein